jgi:hypothetical protein
LEDFLEKKYRSLILFFVVVEITSCTYFWKCNFKIYFEFSRCLNFLGVNFWGVTTLHLLLVRYELLTERACSLIRFISLFFVIPIVPWLWLLYWMSSLPLVNQWFVRFELTNKLKETNTSVWLLLHHLFYGCG